MKEIAERKISHMEILNSLNIPDSDESEGKSYTSSDGSTWEIRQAGFVASGSGGDFRNTPCEPDVDSDTSLEYALYKNGKIVKRLSSVKTRYAGYEFAGERDGCLLIKDLEFTEKYLKVRL
ncbi:MAG: hypothetical protein K6F35_12005 [Lachnospiraceae bacterium]|nr:hypothetical protein [Lachnospiraceae bacterium]